MKIPQNVIFKNSQSESNHLLESSQDLDSKLSKPNYSLQRINDLLVISTYKLEQKVKLLKQTNAICERFHKRMREECYSSAT
jgi:hypothetical protein